MSQVDPYGLQTGVEALPAVAPSAAETAAAACSANPLTCAAATSGIGGFIVGSMIYPHIEPILSPAIDAVCRDDPTAEECDREWEQAINSCRRFIWEEQQQKSGRRKPRSVGGVTGGYTDVMDCARGLVSEKCGGNRVDQGSALPKKRRWRF